MTRIRIPAGEAALLAAAIIALPAITRAQKPDHTRPTFEPGPCPFDAAALDVSRIRCGHVAVPENRENPDGRVIRLAVAVAEPAVALGYPEWDLFGGSYGSWIARRVLREDPRGTRSATIMAGPPADPTRLLTRDIPFFHRALKHVFSLCEADSSCRDHHPRLEEVFYDTYEHLEREPWTVTVDPTRFRRARFTVNGQDFIRMMYWLLGDSDFVHLPALVTAFHDRDEAVARRVIDRQYGGLSSSFSTGMAYAVECYESHTPESRGERERAAAPFPAPLLDIRDFLAPCDDLHPARASAEEREVIRSTIPTLIVSAEHDMMGPPDVGEEIRRSLPNSAHVVLPGATHNAAFGPDYRPCLREIVMRFLEDPTVRPATECLATVPRPTISPGVPAWAQPSR